MNARHSGVAPSELLLYRRILLWNYYDMWEKAEKGLNFGFIEDLKDLPVTFRDAEVRLLRSVSLTPPARLFGEVLGEPPILAGLHTRLRAFDA